jgi:hypothetical protein
MRITCIHIITTYATAVRCQEETAILSLPSSRPSASTTFCDLQSLPGVLDGSRRQGSDLVEHVSAKAASLIFHGELRVRGLQYIDMVVGVRSGTPVLRG